MDFDLILRGGTVVTADGARRADLGIVAGRVAAVGDLPAGPAIDVAGRLVMPGGVDVHAHVEQMSGAGLMNADTFQTAHRAALAGGTTTVVSFVAQPRGVRLRDAVADYAARADRGALADHAFHLIVADVTHLAEDLPALARAGHRSLKVFTTYPAVRLGDAEVLEVLTLARRHGCLTCIHAETDAILTWTTARLLERGLTAPKWHAVAHARMAEVEAVERSIRFAEFTGAAVMVFHVSTVEGVEAVRRAKDRGAPVRAETCPHYLLMGPEVLDGDDGAKYLCSPPQREEADREALWAGLADGTIDLISSDHAPYRMDASGKLANGADAPFTRMANGMPGLQPRMGLIWDAMAARGMAAAEFVRLCCTAPADAHGLAAKGRLDVGADADVVVWDPDARVTWADATQQDNAGYCAWAGRGTRGAPVMVLRRGEIVARGETVTAPPCSGRWQSRAPFVQGVPAPEARIALGED